MKIILGSDLSFLLKYGYDLTGIPKDQMRIGYVITAAKAARKKDFFEKAKTAMRENGYYYEEVDIEDKSPDEIRDFFKDKNVIHVEGGNTFYLLKAVRKTHFDKVIKELLDQGKVYIGTSAGSYLMSPSIEVSCWRDNTQDRFGVTDFTALSYVPNVLKVHYQDEMEDSVRENMKALKYPLRILRNGEGILVEDGKTEFFGDQKETVL